ncbi:MAG: Acyltransferase, partial [Ilumatobacteraceae bacterium]|nr:Acyltransferase [Ilumatobacteraceae bacterium]
VSALADGQGLNMTVQSYNGNLDFGFIACRDLVPDLAVMSRLLTESMAELLALCDPVEVPSAAAPAPRAPATGSPRRRAPRAAAGPATPPKAVALPLTLIEGGAAKASAKSTTSKPATSKSAKAPKKRAAVPPSKRNAR